MVGVVPLLNPEKNASAIWQKKTLPATSVNGTVVDTPPQLPVSAGSRLDANEQITSVRARVTDA